MSPAPTFADILSEAIDRRGLSLSRIRYHLRRRGHELSVATLSYWRRGLSRPTRVRSLAAVEALEAVLELRAGTLLGALTESSLPAGEGTEGAERLAAELGLSWDDGLSRTSLQDTVVVDAAGMQSAHVVRESFVAHRAGVDRYPIGFWHDETCVSMRPVARGACTLGRERSSDNIVVLEVVLPRVLEIGERWMTEIAVLTEGQREPMVQWSRYVTTECRFLHYNIVFAPEKVPLSAEVLTEVRGVETRRPLILSGPSLDVHLQDFGPGSAELSWTW